jgi:hypothetical protein
MRHRFWTPEEDRLMQQEYPCGGWRHVQALLPHRSQQAIINRASWLCVAAKLTQDDKQLIVALYPAITKQAIADKFGVTRMTIYKVLKEVA